MTANHPPIGPSERLDLILSGLREVVAARGGLVGPLIALLCGRLIRRGPRFAALLAAFRAGKLRAPRPRAARPPRPVRSGQPHLPEGFGWLIRLCGWQAACYGGQLRQLLAEPEMAALLLASPQAGRLFRPLCRMLAVELPAELALRRRRSKPASSPDAVPARAGVKCHRWRVMSIAAEGQAAAPEAPAPLVAWRSPPRAVKKMRAASLWPREQASLPREAAGRGTGPPGDVGRREPVEPACEVIVSDETTCSARWMGWSNGRFKPGRTIRPGRHSAQRCSQPGCALASGKLAFG